MSLKPTYSEKKIAEAARIKAQTEAFIAQGGKIQACDHTQNQSWRERGMSMSKKKQVQKQRKNFQINPC